MVSKKEREQFYLDEVIKLGCDLPYGNITKSESPDFLLTTINGQVIGIEVTRFFHGNPRKSFSLRQREVLYQQVIDEAYRLFFNTHTEPIFVLFSWNDICQVKSFQVYSLAKKIVEVLEYNIPQKIKEHVHLKYEYFWQIGMSNYLHGMDIFRFSKSNRWGFIEAGFTGVSVDDIQGMISSKNLKVDSYRKKAQYIWLIIVAEGIHISSSISLSNEVKSHRFRSNFDRILIYERVENKIIPLIIDR
jgi:hypothetical protein